MQKNNISRYCLYHVICCRVLLPVPQLERCSRGRGQDMFLGGGQNFWVGLVFTKFSVNLKKSHCTDLVYFSPSSLLVSETATILKLPQGKGEFGWHAGQFGGRNFWLGGAPPPFPLVAALSTALR